MAESPASTDSTTLLFPAFLYGDHASCRRKMKAEAKKWGKRYDERRDFPEPKLVPVPPGSVIFMGCQNDIALVNMGMGVVMKPSAVPPPPSAMIEFGPRPNRDQPRWYFYLIDELDSETFRYASVPHEAMPVFDAALEAFLCRYPWGALSLAIHHPLYNTIAAVSQRVEGVLSFWEKLDTLRYVNIQHSFGTLTNLIRFAFQGHIAMWVDAPTGDIRQDLRTAIDHMRRASDDEIHARILRRLHEVAITRPDLRHREWVNSPGVIEAKLEVWRTTYPMEYINLTAGVMGPHYGFVGQLSRDFPGDASSA